MYNVHWNDILIRNMKSIHIKSKKGISHKLMLSHRGLFQQIKLEHKKKVSKTEKSWYNAFIYLHYRGLNVFSIHNAGNTQVDLKRLENSNQIPNASCQQDAEINFSVFSEYQQNITACQMC